MLRGSRGHKVTAPAAWMAAPPPWGWERCRCQYLVPCPLVRPRRGVVVSSCRSRVMEGTLGDCRAAPAGMPSIGLYGPDALSPTQVLDSGQTSAINCPPHGR
ncbi:hypothetical protein GCM10009646_61360 [Streptomyces aureus]